MDFSCSSAGKSVSLGYNLLKEICKFRTEGQWFESTQEIKLKNKINMKKLIITLSIFLVGCQKVNRPSTEELGKKEGRPSRIQLVESTSVSYIGVYIIKVDSTEY